MENVSFKLDLGLAKDVENCMGFAHYSTKTEFIREAIRDKVSSVKEEMAKEKAWERLFAMRGMLKDQAISDKEFYRIRREFSKEVEKKLKAKYGIK